MFSVIKINLHEPIFNLNQLTIIYVNKYKYNIYLILNNLFYFLVLKMLYYPCNTLKRFIVDCYLNNGCSKIIYFYQNPIQFL